MTLYEPDDRDFSPEEVLEEVTRTAKNLLILLDTARPAAAGICSLALFELMTCHACPPGSFQVNWTSPGPVEDVFSDPPFGKETKFKRDHAKIMLDADLNVSVNWFLSAHVPEKSVEIANKSCINALDAVDQTLSIWLHGPPDRPAVSNFAQDLVAGYTRLYFSLASQVRYWSVVFKDQHKITDTTWCFKETMCKLPIIRQALDNEEDLQEFFDFNMSDSAYGSD